MEEEFLVSCIIIIARFFIIIATAIAIMKVGWLYVQSGATKQLKFVARNMERAFVI